MKPEARNPHLDQLNPDYLYHLGLDTGMDIKGMFGDVKYVCMGGSSVRAEDFAKRRPKNLELMSRKVE